MNGQASEHVDDYQKKGFAKKTCMKSKTSHQTNKNFTIQTQFPFASFIVGIFQNFHDKDSRNKGKNDGTFPSHYIFKFLFSPTHI